MIVDDLTAAIVAVTLADKVDLAALFCLESDEALRDWTVIVDPELDGWVIRWPYLRLTVGARGDLDLARAIVRERFTGLHAVDEAAVLARRVLGWGRGEPHVVCVVCRTSARASAQHRPGGLECRDTLADRRTAHAS